MTLYERLLYASDDPDAQSMARQMVAGQVAAIIASWQEGSALEESTFQATRNDLHQRRL